MLVNWILKIHFIYFIFMRSSVILKQRFYELKHGIIECAYTPTHMIESE